MEQKPIVIVISDIHLGCADSNDDHVYDKNQLSSFIKTIPEARDGKVELFINGDFLEFAQVKPEVYTLNSKHFWCSEQESLEKLEVIISGHKDVFEALKGFQEKGNVITIAPGNHDVDLFWGKVRERIIKEIGSVNFEEFRDHYYRFNNKLLIGHGHSFDPANRFKNWTNPNCDSLGVPLRDASGMPRLEMCPGTLFMVKIVNWLEKDYPFADNVKPFSAFARLLLRENKVGLVAIAMVFFKFLCLYPQTTLSTNKESAIQNISELFILEINMNDEFFNQVAAFYNEINTKDSPASKETILQHFRDPSSVMEFINSLFEEVDIVKWVQMFDAFSLGDVSSTLSINSQTDDHDINTLSAVHSARLDEKKELSEHAQQMIINGQAEIVVFGHTHQPDEWRGENEKLGGWYFNPGSWTRYVEIKKLGSLSLNDLRNEADFPYELNYIRIEETEPGKLKADKHTYEKANGKRFNLSS